MATHTRYETHKGQEEREPTRTTCHPFLSLPMPILARPLSWACRSLPKGLLTAPEAAATRAGRARCPGRVLPPERKHARDPPDKPQALTGFLEPGLGLRLARLTLGSDRSSSRALLRPFPLMSAHLPRAAATARPGELLYGRTVNRTSRAFPTVSRSLRRRRRSSDPNDISFSFIHTDLCRSVLKPSLSSHQAASKNG